MPIRATKKDAAGSRTALCINCEDEVLNMPNTAFNLVAKNGYAETGDVAVFAAICRQCGYVELYADGYLFSSNTNNQEAS